MDMRERTQIVDRRKETLGQEVKWSTLIPGKVLGSDSHEHLASVISDLNLADAMQNSTHCRVISVAQG